MCCVMLRMRWLLEAREKLELMARTFMSEFESE
jgi:hypothetical protein